MRMRRGAKEVARVLSFMQWRKLSLPVVIVIVGGIFFVAATIFRLFGISPWHHAGIMPIVIIMAIGASCISTGLWFHDICEEYEEREAAEQNGDDGAG